MLVLDAALTGAKGVNLWASFPRRSSPQRKARLYTALVERGLASSVSGALLPTAQPFLYTLSLTAMEGVALGVARGGAARGGRARCGRTGVTEAEVARARKQLRARLVFESDSVTNIAHQLGYFDTVAGPGLPAAAAGRHRRGHRRAGQRRGAPAPRPARRARSAGSSRRTDADDDRADGAASRPSGTALANGAVVLVQADGDGARRHHRLRVRRRQPVRSGRSAGRRPPGRAACSTAAPARGRPT